MNIDASKLIPKCDIDDCGQNTDHVCCIACKSFNECIQKNWICSHLDNDYDPTRCMNLYFVIEKEKSE